MKEFKINDQQVQFITNLVNEGTFPFPAKNLSSLFDMLKNLEEIKVNEVENKE